MAVFFDLTHLPDFNNAVLTVGTFDGVHLGHRAILDRVVSHAKKVNGQSVLLTFEPHPRKLLFPNQSLGIITPLPQKIQLLHEAGIEHIVVAPFTREFSMLSAHDYIKEFLVRRFHPNGIIIGHDHHFGNDRKGNIHLLKEYAQEFNYELIEIPAQLIDDAAVSSTKIRHAITEGNMESVTAMLGREYSLSGTVMHGNRLGRTLGYPTANLQPGDNDQIIPAIGIYAIHAIHDGAKYDGMLSIGVNPTVTDKKALRIEANLFDFNKDIYGDTLDICLIKRIRDELKFPSLDALIEQIHKDKAEAQRILTTGN